MRKKLVHILAAISVFVGVSALADTLVERFGDTHAGLPEFLRFDCSDPETGWIEAFGQTMRIPRNFQGISGQGVGNQGASLEWPIPLANGLITHQYASISTFGMDNALEKFDDNPTVSAPAENSVGVYVQVSEIALGEVGESHGVILLSENEILLASSLVPMDWQSLLDCFQPILVD